MVLAEVWRGLDGVGPLSNAQGGPLSRTVKLILDPLVLRPVHNPACAGALLTAEGVRRLSELVSTAAEPLRHTAAWFTVFKQVRRRLRITEGNPQDLYFQRCHELAVISGGPEESTAETVVEHELRALHGAVGGRTTQALREYIAAHLAELENLISVSWSRLPDHLGRGVEPGGQRIELIDRVLDAGPTARPGAAGRSTMRGARPVTAPIEVPTTDGRENGARALTALVAERAGTALGLGLRSLVAASATAGSTGESEPAPIRPAAAADGSETSPWTARRLGLTRHAAPPMPEIGGSASTSTLGLPFDRTVHERVFTVLQTAPDRAALPSIPELVHEEIDRSCAPWALADESLRVAATIGVRFATGLRPLGDRGLASAGRTAAHRTVNARWRREAYVLQARRLALNPVEPSSSPGPADPLTRLAAELTTPWQGYLRRLWVRLHGRDVRAAPVTRVDDLWDLLDGVARSLILDHRSRVRHALSLRSTQNGPEDTIERPVR
ncbi:hypothetical protein TL08_15255 [Actinoalloteichus hymeniacidonis]|uniref:Uncharacterized protein n=2 Tax=Actinoalloteichus hymeniacidonis TaxID=340345 RepID=A0AAC9HSW0_9PSEU|nr:hypothetical protein TL08_15255 [Actinoalloteichus hymeniacidonis]